MRFPYLFGPVPVIGDNTRTVAHRAARFILVALINNTFSLHSGQIFSVIFVPSLVSPLCDQPIALVHRNLVFLDRARNGRLFVRSVVDDADELRRRPANVVDGP
jgi:hypothetical protein